MGQDARVRYTKKVIKEVIISLLQEKPFHKITLTEVCKLAEINRTTFYKHYKDLYDWKEQLENECLQRTSTILEQADMCNMKEILTQQFRDMRDNAELYILISSPNFESKALEQAISIILETADFESKQYLSLADEQDYRRKWDCYLVIYGCIGVIQCWINDGMREDPEKLAVYYMNCIKDYLFQMGQ